MKLKIVFNACDLSIYEVKKSVSLMFSGSPVADKYILVLVLTCLFPAGVFSAFSAFNFWKDGPVQELCCTVPAFNCTVQPIQPN